MRATATLPLLLTLAACDGSADFGGDETSRVLMVVDCGDVVDDLEDDGRYDTGIVSEIDGPVIGIWYPEWASIDPPRTGYSLTIQRAGTIYVDCSGRKGNVGAIVDQPRYVVAL